MSTLKETLWLAEQATQAALLFWPVSVFIAVFAATSTILDFRKRRGNFKKSIIRFLSPTVFPVLIILIGSILRNQAEFDFIPMTIVGVSAIISVCIVVTNKEFWSSGLGINLAIMWTSVLAHFIATMSISNDWL